MARLPECSSFAGVPRAVGKISSFGNLNLPFYGGRSARGIWGRCWRCSDPCLGGRGLAHVALRSGCGHVGAGFSKMEEQARVACISRIGLLEEAFTRVPEGIQAFEVLGAVTD